MKAAKKTLSFLIAGCRAQTVIALRDILVDHYEQLLPDMYDGVCMQGLNKQLQEKLKQFKVLLRKLIVLDPRGGYFLQKVMKATVEKALILGDVHGDSSRIEDACARWFETHGLQASRNALASPYLARHRCARGGV